jgi:putative FmdB family regulatory protein
VPTYDYRCSACDNFYEKQEGFDAPSTQPCPRCGAPAKRVFSPPPIIFKGSGFYVTDSKKSGGGSASIGLGPSKENGSSETTTPATPAADSTSTPAAPSSSGDTPAAPAAAASD